MPGKDTAKDIMKNLGNQVEAVCVADLHLSSRPPLARSCEDDWLAVQAGYLRQLWNMTCDTANYDADGRTGEPVPIICAGDVFDKWNERPEIINVALRELPIRSCYAIWGQHDSPNHSAKQLKRSAYWSLVEAKRIVNLRPGRPVGIGRLRLWGFPFGTELKPLPPQPDRGLVTEVAVIHRYVWTRDTGHEGAREEDRVGKLAKLLRGYDVVVSGDNHTSFDFPPAEHQKKLGAWICNVGTFMRRKADERNHRPSVGLLRSDGSIERRYLDCSADKFVEDRPRPDDGSKGIDAERFLRELGELGETACDFGEALQRAIDSGTAAEVKKIIEAALEEERK